MAVHRREVADYGAGDLQEAGNMPRELIQEVTSQTQGRSCSVQVLHSELLSE